MNIFALSRNPRKAAIYHCDIHVRKMVTETCQMLSTAHRVLNPEYAKKHNLYKTTHANHPCNVWIRENPANYLWAYQLAVALIEEYDYRGGDPNKYTRLRQLLKPLRKTPCGKTAVSNEPTDFVLGFKAYPELHGTNKVLSYRAFYIADKYKFAEWGRGRKAPKWWPTDIRAKSRTRAISKLLTRAI